MMNIPFPTDEEKEQAIDKVKQTAFKERIRKEREAEALELAIKMAKEEVTKNKKVVKAKKPKKEKKPRKPRAKKVVVKKEKKVVVKEEKKKIQKLPVYHNKIKVNQFNKAKVEYLQKRAYYTKDPIRKAMYVNALTKYDL